MMRASRQTDGQKCSRARRRHLPALAMAPRTFRDCTPHNLPRVPAGALRAARSASRYTRSTLARRMKSRRSILRRVAPTPNPPARSKVTRSPPPSYSGGATAQRTAAARHGRQKSPRCDNVTMPLQLDGLDGGTGRRGRQREGGRRDKEGFSKNLRLTDLGRAGRDQPLHSDAVASCED